MNERYLTWSELDELEELPRWVDAHSVTCIICGELADERQTVNVWPDAVEEYGVRTKRLVAAKEFGFGEAHQSCFDEQIPKTVPIKIELLGRIIWSLENIVNGNELDDQELAYVEDEIESLTETLGVDPREYFQ